MRSHADRLDLLPPYLFAELERKISAKKAAGIDVISLGIGDPDRPTPALIVDAGPAGTPAAPPPPLALANAWVL